MDRIFIAMRYRSDDNYSLNFIASPIFELGYFSSRKIAYRKLEEYLSDQNFMYKIDNEYNYIVSEELFYSIIPLDKNDD